MLADNATDWDYEISSENRFLRLNLLELWRYRDLLLMFVQRDIVTVYKQTILGPIWFVLQPLFTTLIFVVLFGRIAGLSPDGVPQFAFYLIGITLWSYFSDTLNVTSKTFTDNSNIFGKVYFPRLVIPLSKVLSGFLKFLMQFGFFIVLWLYYILITRQVTPNWYILLTPLLLLDIVLLSLGLGIMITSLTTKYRDLTFLISFGMQLFMYATPVAYSMSNPKISKYHSYIWFNPLTSLFEAFKYGFLGTGVFSIKWLLYSVGVTFIVLLLSIYVFNKVEKKFIDTV